MFSAIYQQEQRAYWAVINIVDLSRSKQMCLNEKTQFSEQNSVLLAHYQRIYYDALNKLGFLYGLSSKETIDKFFGKFPELKKL